MDGTSVRVAVRVRPLLDSEKKDRCTECVRVVANQPQITFGNDQSFTFDNVFGTTSQQEDLYEACVSNLVDATFEGFNATVLAYGQTSSGKTYTMGSASNLRLAEEEYGIIPRVARHLFDNVQLQEAEDNNSTYRVRIQFLEIYGEEIRDLLDPSNTGKVTIRETPAGGVYVSGAREELVTSADEMLAVLEKGSAGRTTGSTRMNSVSSRSHAIFTILLERTIHYPANSNSIGSSNDSPENGTNDLDNILSVKAVAAEPEVRKCKFHFVDLAGSERAKRTGAEGIRLREGIDINKGLLALGNVISALGDEQKKGKVHVPYRDSKLTRILQDSLGGNSKTQMICCVSPADINYQESLNAIKYANRARNIKNKPIVNLDPTAVIISELKSHIKILATELLTFREGNISPTEIGTQYTLQMLKELADAKPGMIGNCSLFRNETSPNGSISGPGTGKFQSSELQKRSKSNFSNMTTIKLEQEILVLKARVEDSDQEILRLSDKIKRYQNQLSDVSDQMVNLQSERDYYRLKLVEMHVPEDGSDKQALTDTIGTYIREIDSLKVLIAKYKLELTQREVFPRESYFSIEETQESDIELSGELSSVAHVIASSEEQLLKEKKLLEKLENGDESGDSESDIQSQIDNHDNMAEKDRVFQKRQKIMTAEVNELSESIQLKEQLVIQLQRSQKQYEIMQRFYEEKLMALCNEMQTKEDEKRRLELELQELSLLKEVEAIKTDREDELKVLLQEKENELHKLRKRQQELSHLSHIQSRSSDQLRKLQQDIVTMKKQRVDLAKKLQSEKKMHLIALNNKAKEIDKLKRDLTRAMAKVQQLGKEKQQVELKFRVTVKDKEIPQKKKRVSEQGSPQDSSPNRSTSRDSRRWGKNTNYLSSNRPLSEEEVRTKKWLDKHVKVIAERETAAEELRLQYEQQLFLAHQKKQLEDVREPIRSLIMQGKRESSDQRGDVLLSAEEEEVLVDVEEKINRLEGQLKYRNEEIDRIEKKLKGGKSSHDKTIEILQQSAAKNLPAAHQLIRLLFDMLVSTRKIARMNKENMDLLRSRETKLTEELEEAQSRLTTIVRIHDKEIARIERDYEEKLAGLFNHTQLSQILTGDNRESNGLLPKDSFEDFDHPSLRPRYIRTSISTSGEDISQGDDRYKTLAALSHERLVAVKSHLMREEARCRELERTIDDYLIERKELKEQYELKIRENKFLDDECRMLRDMVQDLKAKLNLENVMQKKNLSALRANDEDSDSSYDDSVILDSAVLGELSSLGDEISRTGSVKFIDQKGQNDIFERLANPSNFTGTQKTIFEGDLETNRAKVQQIKEGSLANKKKRGDNKPISTNPLLIEEFENGENEEFPQTPKEDALYQPELEVEASHSTRDDFMESRLNSTPRRATFDPLQSPDNVFSRLLNPSKFTGIHRRRTDNLDLPHSSHGFSSNDVKNRRSVKSGGSSSGNTSSPPGKSTSTDDFQLSMSEYEVPNRKQVERPRSEHNVFTRLQRKVSDGIAKTKGSKSAANK